MLTSFSLAQRTERRGRYWRSALGFPSPLPLASRLPWAALLAGSFLAAFAPMFIGLIDGPWATEQEGHGPLIIAGSLWLTWRTRARRLTVPRRPAPIVGWAFLTAGLLLMFLARTQDLLGVQALSAIAVLVGCILLAAGWPMLRVLAFPVGFLLFAVPFPDWLIDAATVPLKVFISDMVTSALYAGGYPVAQNGVMIMIGNYEVLVKDACSGINSIVALAAIGVFYTHNVAVASTFRRLFLLASIIPIAICANFIRVVILVLIAYYGGVDQLDGPLHGLTSLSLFLVALALLYLFDQALRSSGLLIKYVAATLRTQQT